ncbi:DUF4124 domain-containing protein [Pulveribacter suum]|uniref:DUF4124 domain-containing protein n=1 Tax=Pulveribacter suum TaxID=2116657 RepID=A0A2P1NHA8_9BURK|nr:DUF4124 domain-containing protein [Pulveribacter suum]
MRSPRERVAWTALAVLALAGAVAAWWTSEQWLPHTGPWTEHVWRKITRPGPETLPRDKGGQPRPAAGAARGAAAGSSEPPAPPRKCVRGSSVVYTDQPCPPGSREAVVDGAVTSLPPPQP